MISFGFLVRISLIALSGALPMLAFAEASDFRPADIARGKYLVSITGCNDCHTSGYAQSGGTTPMAQWLMGDGIGFKGPWGTTYPANLRMFFQRMSEKEWLTWAKTMKTRPPMPWFALRDMTERDLRAIYRFTRSLGPGGTAAPAFVPPGAEPETPYFVLDPAMPAKR